MSDSRNLSRAGLMTAALTMAGGGAHAQCETLLNRPDRTGVDSLVHFVSAALRIDDYTPLHSLEWPQNAESAPWAPTSGLVPVLPDRAFCGRLEPADGPS